VKSHAQADNNHNLAFDASQHISNPPSFADERTPGLPPLPLPNAFALTGRLRRLNDFHHICWRDR
jgi:hypothetical protein